MKVVVLIPARMAATRFPGKPLSAILGKPMIQWVYERGVQSRADRVIVATDSSEIFETVRGFGGEAVMTRSDHLNGTERIAEAAESLDAEWIVNIQGDEPTIHSGAIDRVIDALGAETHPEMATLAEPIHRHEDVLNPNIVKLVTDRNGRALYFSRAPIPFVRNRDMGEETVHYRHVGVYGYRRDFLLRYVQQPSCAMERLEGLEQLRALYMGATIRVEITEARSVGVDLPEDIAKAEQFLMEEGSQP